MTVNAIHPEVLKGNLEAVLGGERDQLRSPRGPVGILT